MPAWLSNSATPWTVAHQAPLSMEFPGKTELTSLMSPALQADSLPTEPTEWLLLFVN